MESNFNSPTAFPMILACSMSIAVGNAERISVADSRVSAGSAVVAKGKRQPVLDVTRGILMAAIMGTHSYMNVDPDSATGWMRGALTFLLAGTVGFTTVSGMLVGYFLAVKRAQLDRVFARYRVQAFRLVLIADVVIAAAVYPRMENVSFLFRSRTTSSSPTASR